MTGIDASIYGQLQAPQSNIAQMIGQGQQIQAQGMQNKLTQMNIDAQEAMGGVLQQSIDPETGQPDFNKFMSAAAAHPKLAWAAPDIYKKLADAQLINSQVVKENLANIQNRMQIFGRVSQAALDAKPQTRGEAISIIAPLLTQAGMSPKETLELVTRLGQTPAEFNKQLQNIAASSLTGEQHVKANLDAIQKHDLGNTVRLTRTDPFTGQVTAVGDMTKGMTPDKANEPVQGYDASGAPTVARTGSDVFGPQIGAQGAQQAMPQQAPGQTPAPGSSPVTSLKPPMNMEVQQDMAKKYEESLMTRRGEYPTQKLYLTEALKTLPTAGIGPGSSTMKAVAEYAKSMGVPPEVANKIAGGDLGSLQYLDKLLTVNAVGSMKQAYNSYQQYSTQQFQIFLASQPNLNTDQATAEHMLRMQLGLVRLQEIESKAYARYKQENSGAGKIPGYSFQEFFTNEIAPKAIARIMQDDKEYFMSRYGAKK